ncbi:hypothetical protein ACXYTJ_16515 [Gilvimarinus sp. F26214L]|uniref:hypothetical protein n=1 Tax=Gilvimarinus sp. DZF01 TaxID=3461371 RepID=UPI004045F6A4
MNKKAFWYGIAIIPLTLITAYAVGRMEPAPEMPEVSLGVMRSCAHMGAVAKQVALDRENDVPVDKARYQYYREYLTRSQPIFDSPRFAVMLAFGFDQLEPETVKNLGVQTCIAAYYGFKDSNYHKTLYEQALECQNEAAERDNPEDSLKDCMGREYQDTLAQWWKEENL